MPLNYKVIMGFQDCPVSEHDGPGSCEGRAFLMEHKASPDELMQLAAMLMRSAAVASEMSFADALDEIRELCMNSRQKTFKTDLTLDMVIRGVDDD